MESIINLTESKETIEALKFFSDPKNDPLYQKMTEENRVFEDLKIEVSKNKKSKPTLNLILER